MSRLDSKKNRRLYFEEVAESLVKNGFYKTKEEALKSVKETALEKKPNAVLVYIANKLIEEQIKGEQE